MNVLTTTVEQAARMTGLGRTKLYELMASGELDSIKVGRRRLIKAESLRRLADNGVAA